MSALPEDLMDLVTLEMKVRAILPGQYSDCYEGVRPVSMGSAPLKYGADGKVAWNEIWTTFCDLAMAGGPPHRGTLLQPASPEAVAADSLKHAEVLNEICRGISMVTGLCVEPSSLPGWVGVRCRSQGMAGWLVRAIVMENVLSWHDNAVLFLPAGPDFRLAKEIKNVVTVTAKTCHYWTDHMSLVQKQSMEAMMASTTVHTELLGPASATEIDREGDVYWNVVVEIARNTGLGLGLPSIPDRYPGWIGIECANISAATWLMRAMIVENVLVRREESVLFLPANPRFATNGRLQRLVDAFTRAYRLHAIKIGSHRTV